MSRRTNRAGGGPASSEESEDSSEADYSRQSGEPAKTLYDVLIGRVDDFVDWLVGATRKYIIERNKIRASKAYARWSKANEKLEKAIAGLSKLKNSVNELDEFKDSVANEFRIQKQMASCDQHLKDGSRSVSAMDSALEARRATAVHFGAQQLDQALLRRGFFGTRFMWQLSLCSTRFVVLMVGMSEHRVCRARFSLTIFHVHAGLLDFQAVL